MQVVAAPAIEKRIFVIRERQVMLDEDLADLYGVETKRLIQPVKRDLKRFPGDFMFQPTRAEAEVLRSQIATSTMVAAAAVFTEQGVAMLPGVRLDQMELDIGPRLSEHDEQIGQIFEALRKLIAPPPRAKRPVGFRVREGDE